jgi:hypothetical protein
MYVVAGLVLFAGSRQREGEIRVQSRRGPSEGAIHSSQDVG